MRREILNFINASRMRSLLYPGNKKSSRHEFVWPPRGFWLLRGEQTGGEPRTDEAETSTCLVRVGPETVPPLRTVATILSFDKGPSTASVCIRARGNSTPSSCAKHKPPQPSRTATTASPSRAISACCSPPLSPCLARPSSVSAMLSQVPAEATGASNFEECRRAGGRLFAMPRRYR